MDTRFQNFYERELKHLREVGEEFARDFPKIASRLSLANFECQDPYVERLLEGFAFMAARVQLELSNQFPQFSEQLTSIVYPHYVCPTPAMTVVHLLLKLNDPALQRGFEFPRGAQLVSRYEVGQATKCTFRTAHDIRLWPVEIRSARYEPFTGDLPHEVPFSGEAQAVLRMTVGCTAGVRFDELGLDRLCFFLPGKGIDPKRVFHQVLGHAMGVVFRARREGELVFEAALDSSCIAARGLDDAESLLPYDARSFQGYRLLHEYFAFPQRYLFFELQQLETVLMDCDHDELEISFVLDEADPELIGALAAPHFALNCTPAINLFPRSAKLVRLDDSEHEHRVVPDPSKSHDYEVFSIEKVTAHGRGVVGEREFFPIYGAHARWHHNISDNESYYTSRRVQANLAPPRKRNGKTARPRDGYRGSEVYVSLVDGDQGSHASDLHALDIRTLSTNRHLASHIPSSTGGNDFTPTDGAPVDGISTIVHISRPRPSPAHGDLSWKLMSHLSSNFLSLADGRGSERAAQLRELLTLYAEFGPPSSEDANKTHIAAIRSVTTTPIVLSLPDHPYGTFARGIEVCLTFDTEKLPRAEAFMLGSVLERFFAKYTSINSIVRTVLKTTRGKEVKRWPARIGNRHLI